MAENVQQLLHELGSGDHAQRTGIVTADRTWTWAEHLDEAATEAAAVAALLDTDRPLHVGVLLGNTPDMLRSMAAGALGGYVVVGLNTTRSGPALEADIARSDCQVILVNAEHADLLAGLDVGGARVVAVDGPEWSPAPTALADLKPLREVDAMDTFMLIFTSGTSGEPKAVQVPHLMVLFAGLNLVGKFEVTHDDVCYVSMPLFHSNAVVAGWSVALNSGAAMVPAKFSASRLLDDVRRFGVTYLNYVGKPLAYVLATTPRDDDADNPLRVAFGNEATDRDIDEFARRFDCRVVDGFGSTELAIIITREEGTPPGSIGKGAEGVAIYDPETKQPCPPAEFNTEGKLVNAEAAIGEIVNTTGGGYFQGYYNNTEATDDRMRDGMYWSGDLGYTDADGWIYLAGRSGDWMRVDGENLATAPIERVLERLSQASRVAVYGVPDPDGPGDQVMVSMVLREDTELSSDGLTEFLGAQPDLARNQWPRYVRIAEELPVTATNKVVKRELKAMGAVPAGGVLLTREARGTTYT